MARRVFLIESLDAAGAAPADARSRLEALELAHFTARGVAVELRSEIALRAEDLPPRRGHVPLIRERAQLSAALDAARADLILVASSAAGGGTVAGWLPPGVTAGWWPTGIAPEADAPPGRARLQAAFGGSSTEGAHAGLEGSVVDVPQTRRPRLSLWDGDYVLVPAALSGVAGEETLRAFATVAEGWDAMDLVVLADPQPDFTQLARGLGIGTRVHFAGPSPREAEFAWMCSASALVLGTSGPISGGLVLRALACGCPVLPLGCSGAGRQLREWLDRRGLMAATPTGVTGGGAIELERILERDPKVEDAIARGRGIAALQRPELVGPRLAAALDGAPQRPRKAA